MEDRNHKLKCSEKSAKGKEDLTTKAQRHKGGDTYVSVYSLWLCGFVVQFPGFARHPYSPCVVAPFNMPGQGRRVVGR